MDEESPHTDPQFESPVITSSSEYETSRQTFVQTSQETNKLLTNTEVKSVSEPRNQIIQKNSVKTQQHKIYNDIKPDLSNAMQSDTDSGSTQSIWERICTPSKLIQDMAIKLVVPSLRF